ncbi:6-phosphogluconolactonase [Roseivivax sp. CAU 1761]
MPLKVEVHPDRAALGRAAADEVAEALRRRIASDGEAALVLATGMSQIEALAALVAAPVDWRRVTAFHLDEYLGLPGDHPASFVRYLRDRFVKHLPDLGEFVPVDGAGDPATVVAALEARIAGAPIAACLAGIGTNGHLAFNEPPADFDTRAAYHLVELAESTRQAPVDQGWFARLDDVPRRGITMSVPYMLAADRLVVLAAGARKAPVVRRILDGPLDPRIPASILREHPRASLHLDREAAPRAPEAGMR